VTLGVGLGLWALLLGAFWIGAQGSEAGPIGTLIEALEVLAGSPWAPAGVFALYLLRPVLLLPITVINLASGFVLGLAGGLPLALVGTLASATVGYSIGRALASGATGTVSGSRPGLPGTLQRHGFVSVVAGGLMYLHADAVNLPAGMLRIRYPLFLAGITVGNSLTMTSAVLAGASAQGLGDASVQLQPEALLGALGLFLLSLLLAYALRRRTQDLERRRRA
jgi:uncharacterized membrane protein YdjX (TVP38/TMEM64 family)